MSNCTIAECNRKHLARGYCHLHYRRWQRHGDANDIRHVHGLTNHSLYAAWKSMRNRCDNANRADYKYYGSRGITYCHGLNDFTHYLATLGEKPDPTYTVDRKDNEKGYYCGNCNECNENGWAKNVQWSSKTVQAINQRMRKDNTSGVAGVYWDKSHGKWHAYIKIERKTIYLGYFSTIEDAAAARSKAAIERVVKEESK